MSGSLAVLAGFLPGPGQIAGQLTGSRATGFAVIDSAMLLMSSVILWSLLIWVLGIAAAAVLGGLPGCAGRKSRDVLRRIAPAAVRNVLFTVAGASVLAGVTACGTVPQPAHAQFEAWTAGEGSAVQRQADTAAKVDVDWPATVAAGARSVSSPVGLDVDWPSASGRNSPPAAHPVTTVAPKAPISTDWPTGDAAKSSPVRGSASRVEAAATHVRGTGTDGAIVVHRGDSLWSIAARHLPPGADAADIERAWHQWYASNTAVIGHDPNLIFPGQILLPPTQEPGK